MALPTFGGKARPDALELDTALAMVDGFIGAVSIPLLRYIPKTLWTGLAAGTDTTDIGPYINTALTDAAAVGAVVQLPPWTLCHSTAIAWSNKGVGLRGAMVKHGVTASSARGTCLKWTGSTGATQVTIGHGGHNAIVEGIYFDAADKAATCVAFATTGGLSTQTIHRPTLRRCVFNGYRGGAVIFGNPSTSTFDSGQFEQAAIDHCKWWGGGATATATAVFGLVLNAQNMEVLNARNLFFDPYTSVGGGPNINHQSHILVRTGGLNLQGVTFTRSTSYNVDVLSECGLVMSHVRTEDPLLLRTASGYPSNPIYVGNVEGRDGAAVGTEDFIYLQSGGGATILLENIKSTGNVSVQGANNCDLRTRNITFTSTATSAGASVRVLGGGPYAGRYDLGTSAGVKRVINSAAKEEWLNSSGTRVYQNNAGKLRMRSLQSAGASSDANNFGGVFSVADTATSATVTFGTAEPDIGYRLAITLIDTTGTPAAGSNRLLKVVRTTGGFTATIEAAPGTGATQTFSWLLYRT